LMIWAMTVPLLFQRVGSVSRPYWRVSGRRDCAAYRLFIGPIGGIFREIWHYFASQMPFTPGIRPLVVRGPKMAVSLAVTRGKAKPDLSPRREEDSLKWGSWRVCALARERPSCHRGHRGHRETTMTFVGCPTPGRTRATGTWGGSGRGRPSYMGFLTL